MPRCRLAPGPAEPGTSLCTHAAQGAAGTKGQAQHIEVWLKERNLKATVPQETVPEAALMASVECAHGLM